MGINDVIKCVARACPDRRNADCVSAAEVMRRLGIAPHCDMWTSYMVVNGALPPVPGRLELLRMVGPGIPKIPDQADCFGARAVSMEELPSLHCVVRR